MLSKEILRLKVKKAIEVMPYNAVVMRKGKDMYHQDLEPSKICELIGYKYVDTSRETNNNISEYGEVKAKEKDKFLVERNEQSLKVLEGDILVINEEMYEVNSLGNINEICFDMSLEVIS